MAPLPHCDGTETDEPVRIAVTGFGPFSKVPVNPSWQCLQPLRERPQPMLTKEGRNAMAIDFFELPVVYHEVLERIPMLHGLYSDTSSVRGERRPYDAFLHIGVAPSRRYCALEPGACRYEYTKPDYENKHAPASVDPETGTVLSGFVGKEWDGNARGRLQSRVHVHDLASKVSHRGKVDMRVSDDAGLFLCEFTYYASMACALRTAGGAAAKPVLFLHIPSENAPYTMGDLTDVVLSVVSELVDEICLGRRAGGGPQLTSMDPTGLQRVERSAIPTPAS